jgi:hypothetical protein
MRTSELFAGIISVILVGTAIVFGVYKFYEWTTSPQQNPGYCIKIETKTVYKTDVGWTDVTYYKDTVSKCVEWENYKP